MIRSQYAHLPVVALTDPGRRGKNNEDRFGVLALQQDDASAPPALLAVLADGIGGHRAGEVAAEMAVNLIAEYVLEYGDQLSPPALLEEAIKAASSIIYEQAESSSERKGMGATCACVYVLGDRLYTASVGDSRIYLLRDGGIQQLTTDHTWVQEALERGLISAQQAHRHPNSHVIRRFLGSPTPPQVDLRLRLNGDESDRRAIENQGLRLREGDRLVLCSDGLTDLVSDEEILAALESQPARPAAESLINLANQRGGHDNITLLVIEVPPGSLPHPSSSSRRRWWLWGCLTLLMVALLGGLLGGGALWLLNRSEPSPTVAPLLNQPSSPPPARQTGEGPNASPTLPAVLIPEKAASPAAPSNPAEGATPTPWPTYTPRP